MKEWKRTSDGWEKKMKEWKRTSVGWVEYEEPKPIEDRRDKKIIKDLLAERDEILAREAEIREWDSQLNNILRDIYAMLEYSSVENIRVYLDSRCKFTEDERVYVLDGEIK